MLCQHEEKQQMAPKDAIYWGEAGRAVIRSDSQAFDSKQKNGNVILF